jgi:hypothetical protein
MPRSGSTLPEGHHSFVETLTMLMTTMIYLKALGVWVLFAGAALVCRMVLDQSLMVYMGVQRAYQLSTLTLCVLC